MKDSRTYLLIVLSSIPMIAMYNAGAAIFRAMGNSNVAMKTSLLMNSINVFGNALLIFGFHRGVEGVAIPTVVSRGVACVVILILLNNQEHELHILHPYPFKIKWNVLKKILYIGIPNGLENSMFQLGKIAVLSLVSGLGTASLAANAVGNNIANFAILPGMSFGFGSPHGLRPVRRSGRFRAGKILHKAYDARGVSLPDRVKPHRDPGAAVYPVGLQSLRRGRSVCKRYYPVSCCLRCDDLAAVLHAAEYAARRGGCEGHHGALHHLHVGVPVWFQLPADHGVPYGNLRCLGCHDHRLACPRDLLCLQV